MSTSDIKQSEFHFDHDDEVRMLCDSNRKLREENLALKEEVISLRRLLFGRKSEKMADIQLELEIKDPEKPDDTQAGATEAKDDTAAEEKQGPKKPKTHKARFTVHTVVEIAHTLIPQEVQENPDEYEELTNSRALVSERIERVPSYLERHLYYRPKYRRKGVDAPPIAAPAPPTIIPGSPIGASIIAHVAYDKYIQALPLYRQIKDLERIGFRGISEEVLCYWMKRVGEALNPLYMAQHRKLLESDALHVDETPIRCLKLDKQQGYMWVARDAHGGGAFYYWHDGRSADALNSLLYEDMSKESGKPYGGTIVTDGYDAYDKWITGLPDDMQPKHQACWTHVRRKFEDCTKVSNDPKWCVDILNRIRALYIHEAKLRKENASAEKILKSRSKDKELVDELFKLMGERLLNEENPPLNKLELALNYALERREQLEYYLEHAEVPMENNAAERAVRPITVGRKNYLFIGAASAGKTSAVLYTMLRACENAHVDPIAWLTDTLRILPLYNGTDYTALLPENYTPSAQN